jgi:hypothetical protein
MLGQYNNKKKTNNQLNHHKMLVDIRMMKVLQT